MTNYLTRNTVVIPGPREARSPESIATESHEFAAEHWLANWGYGFRTRRSAAIRNDEVPGSRRGGAGESHPEG
jgi:hypothetical protein